MSTSISNGCAIVNTDIGMYRHIPWRCCSIPTIVELPDPQVEQSEGPDSDAWTLPIARDVCVAREQQAGQADLVMRQSLEIFVRIFNAMIERGEKQ